MSDQLNKALPPGINEEAHQVRYDFIKSNHFRVIHVDGICGGISPRGGLVHMAVWNERWPIPKQTVHEFTPDAEVGKEILAERVMRNAIVREVEAQLVMDISEAKRLRDWLDDKIKSFEEGTKQLEKGEEK
jgi:hypothetical protein